MDFVYNNKTYQIEIIKKPTNKNTYIRVKEDLVIYVTAPTYASNKELVNIITKNSKEIATMIKKQESKQIKKQDLVDSNQIHYLGKKLNIVATNMDKIVLMDDRILLNKNADLNKWQKDQAQKVYKERLEILYKKFNQKIPYPKLVVRKMTSRWGVCNTKEKKVTLNLLLLEKELKYIDYVIIHELSHLVHPNHSASFWSLVGTMVPNYKEIKKEMKE